MNPQGTNLSVATVHFKNAAPYVIVTPRTEIQLLAQCSFVLALCVIAYIVLYHLIMFNHVV